MILLAFLLILIYFGDHNDLTIILRPFTYYYIAIYTRDDGLCDFRIDFNLFCHFENQLNCDCCGSSTASKSSTPTRTPSISPTRSRTASRSLSPSRTASRSISPSITPSKSYSSSIVLSCNQLSCGIVGDAIGYSAIATTTITNAGLTNIEGDIGVAPGTSITGFPPGTVTGSIRINDPITVSARDTIIQTYNLFNNCPCETNLSNMPLDGVILPPGVYCFDSSAAISGTLTLDGMGNPNSMFIFKVGSTLTTDTLSNILLINAATPCNVYWLIGSSATLGTFSDFSGNILSQVSITSNSGASVNGNLYALGGAITFDTTTVTGCACTQ